MWSLVTAGAPLALCAVALVTEAAIGYPARLFDAVGHPVTWIGRLIDALDRRFNDDGRLDRVRRGAGALSLVVMLVSVALAAVGVQWLALALLPEAAALLLCGVAGSSCLAQRSLGSHVRAVAEALERDGLAAARRSVAMIVGRDTAQLDEAGVARAAIESLAENFSDGVVAPALWLALLGLPGGVLYKGINTADSMIGHRTPRHAAFGFAAAKLDDLVNWPAARLAALWLVAAAAVLPDASSAGALRIVRRDANGHASPNAGWPEAAMAGALGLQLGGPRAYGGRMVVDAAIGDGTRAADAAAIRRALRLYRLACGLEIAVAVALALVTARW